MRTAAVLAAIDLNNQPALKADKIYNEAINWSLTAKVKSVGGAERAKLSPKLLLVRRQVVAEFSRDLVCHTPPGFSLRSKPPSPSRGG
jgi:hypothetical protein